MDQEIMNNQDTNTQDTNTQGNYLFDMSRVEKKISTGVLLVFVLFFMQNSLTLLAIQLAITVAIFIYFFGWYKKKSIYVSLEGGKVTVYPFPFFKPREISWEQLRIVRVLQNKIELEYLLNGITKRVNIYSSILSPADWQQVSFALSQLQH